jgi:hypothetical protein
MAATASAGATAKLRLLVPECRVNHVVLRTIGPIPFP